MEENPNKLLLFFDEARFGTHTKLGHGWFPKGKRTQIKAKLGFKSFYLYSAIAPKAGRDYTLQLPSVNTACLNPFLKYLKEELGDQEIILVMDGAGWHKSEDLEVPETIEIRILPPYSPELNPVETFWQLIKKHTLKNQIFENLEDLEIAVAGYLKSLTLETVASVYAVNYL